MTLLQLCKVGVEELVSLALTGKLRPSQMWIAMDGAGKYRDAVVNGDESTKELQAERMSRCTSCENITWSNSKMSNVRKGWCGAPFVETKSTCGCLVALAVFGDGIQPGAKVAVKSETCPSGRW